MAPPKGARARSQLAGRGAWDAHLLAAVASQLASSFQFGSGGTGRRGENFQGRANYPFPAGQHRKQ
eukprot:14720438-Heterocapsa_arctica.AAC.1